MKRIRFKDLYLSLPSSVKGETMGWREQVGKRKSHKVARTSYPNVRSTQPGEEPAQDSWSHVRAHKACCCWIPCPGLKDERC